MVVKKSIKESGGTVPKKPRVKIYKIFLLTNWVTTYKNVALRIKCCDGIRKDCSQIHLTVQVDLSWCF